MSDFSESRAAPDAARPRIGPVGSDGPPGSDDAAGPDGPAGSDGVVGPVGSDRVAGPVDSDRVAGPVGSDRVAGVAGVDGVDGVAAGTVADKRAVRVAVLAARRALTDRARADAAARVQAELTALVRRVGSPVVAAYAPIGAEPGGADLPEVLADALGVGGRVLLPVLLPDLDLDWAGYAGPADLAPAGRGMREPTGARLGVAAVTRAALVVVPAVAVDRRGVRLGRGGGSYDRVLGRLRSAGAGPMIVALLHDGELVDALPTEPHDQRVDAVIAPTAGLVTLG